MKKTISITLALVLLVSLCLSAMAAPGSFIVSPSNNTTPILVDSSNESHDCTAEIVITPYSERDTLPEDAKQKIEDAYDSIAGTSDLTDLNSDLAGIAESMNISTGALGVSDLFDVSYNSCDVHNEHGKFTIKLEAEMLDSFVALMYWDGSNWVIVEGAFVDENGYLNFVTDKFGPYAIVVNTGAENVEPPKTGDEFPWIYVVLMVASAAGLVVVLFLSRKKKA